MPPITRSALLALSALGLASAIACSGSPGFEAPGDGSGGKGNSSGGSGSGTGGGLNVGAGPSSGGTPGGMGGDPVGPGTAVCGNEVIESPERCDDGNEEDGDGCSSECVTESGYACPVPGEACVLRAVCGDGNLGLAEECDDANGKSGDGCTDKCRVEEGWQCPSAGSRCVAVGCGDGVIAGNEQCEDGSSTPESGDGCSETCRLEPGYFCSEVGEPCAETTCGNGVREGDEPCDDGNQDVGDGCTPLCEREPTCVDGACSSTCGDGMILPGDGEECDDGNVSDGDGCSSTCQEEDGYECMLVTEEPPEELVIPIVYRDFMGKDQTDQTSLIHPDFNVFGGSGTKNLVLSTLNDGKPQYAGICDNSGSSDNSVCPDGKQLTTEANFDEWYHDGERSIRVDQFLTLDRNDSGQYEFNSNGNFFPLKDAGWVAEGSEDADSGKNFSFTSELRYWFQLEGGEKLTFNGDDDVWVFINNRMMIDLGGLHSATKSTIELSDDKIAELGMTKDRIYEVVLFHAERRENQSNFRLTLNGFVKTKSACVAECGDGIVAGDEVCDDGEDGGGYGSCKADCSGLDVRCGDSLVQDEQGELCDDGSNLTSYDFAGTGEGCAPGCSLPAACGDGVVDVGFGEQCDDGNLVDGDGCESNCTYRAKCGNGVVDKADGETCDDGNRINGDGCSQFCTEEEIVVR